MARSYQLQSRYNKARAQYNRAIAVYRSLYGETSEKVIDVLALKANIFRKQRRYDEAFENYEEAIRLFRVKNESILTDEINSDEFIPPKSTEPSLRPRRNESSIKQAAPHRGLVFQPVPGDGHCLFHAVGLYLGQDADFLRNMVAAHMEANAAEFINFIEGGDGEFSHRLEAIRNADEWGDQPEILAIQRATDRPVIIFKKNDNPMIPDDIANYNEPPIFLYYDGSMHYDAFVVKDGFDPVGILADINERMTNGEIVNFNILNTTEKSIDKAKLKKSKSTSASVSVIRETSGLSELRSRFKSLTDKSISGQENTHRPAGAVMLGSDDFVARA